MYGNIKDICISIKIITPILTEGYTTNPDFDIVCCKGLPVGAKLLDSWWDDKEEELHLIYQHESFEFVSEGQPVPYLNISFTKYLRCCRNRGG